MVEEGAKERTASEHKGRIPIVETFGPTIQGEGLLAGQLTWFIRVGACDYANVCATCDSMHAVDPRQYKKSARWLLPGEIGDELVDQMPPKSTVTISGGNPAMWDMSADVWSIQESGHRVVIETQGSKWMDWLAYVDILTIAPKGPGMMSDNKSAEWSFENFATFLRLLHGVADRSCRVVIKLPVFAKGDLDFAERIMEYIKPWGYPLYLSVGNPAVYAHNISALRNQLLGRYESIIGEVFKRPHLSQVIILPQLHVLVWGNKQGV